MNFLSLKCINARKEIERTCLSCGSTLTDRRRRYCSQDCQNQLRSYLNRRTGLLAALNTRYATFYFDDFFIVMDILPYGTEQIFSFVSSRTPGKKPVDDYCGMSHFLGSVWWSERKRTQKRYLASLSVLSKAQRVDSPLSTVIPRRVLVPAVKFNDLSILSLTKEDITSEEAPVTIKNAFRRKAKVYHPDLGGKASKFRQLLQAYEKLVEWSQNPTYLRYVGFPDKWLYEGSANRWKQPSSLTRETR